MKTKLAVLTMTVLSLCMLIPTSAMAIRLVVEAGDRPYYTYGPGYWDRGYEWVWVPGHWSRHRHVWIHGHYVRRGGFYREHFRDRYYRY